MLDFYETLLNIQQWDSKKIISILERCIKLEMLEVDKYTDDYEGLCKVFANNLYEKLTSYGINVKMINLNELYREMKEHVFLIMSYKDLENHFNYVLIDPTYTQFVKKDNKKSPLYFEAWPSEILQNTNPNLLKNLINDKYSFIDDKNLQDYLRSFTDKQVKINLESIIIDKYKDRRRRY